MKLNIKAEHFPSMIVRLVYISSVHNLQLIRHISCFLIVLVWYVNFEVSFFTSSFGTLMPLDKLHNNFPVFVL
jgi:hypothetical protein